MNKKILLALSLGVAVFTASAQDQPFFEKVNYVGGMGLTDWSKPWANFRPDTLNYPATTIEVAANITTNTTWTANNVYHLSSFIYVKAGATLTIEPGTVIRGARAGNNLDPGSSAGSLIVARGGKIYAVGTPQKPIVFTSDKPVGSRKKGDWAGVLIFGKARQNVPTHIINAGTANQFKEHYFEALPDASDNYYGGNDDQDSSGVMKYVRIEYAGWYAIVDKEINGLTIGGVGNRTHIDNIQCSYTDDDSFEWFGGTVNHKNLIAFASQDDDFDTDGGYRGNLQFLIGLRHPLYSDKTSSNRGASRGYESDNNTDNNTVAGQINPLPITAPIFCNVTLMGPIPNGGNANANLEAGNKFKQGIMIRNNSSLSSFNTIIAGYPLGFGLNHSDLSNTKSTYSKAQADSISIRNMVIADVEKVIDAMTSYPTALSPAFDTKTWWETPDFQNDQKTYFVTEDLNIVNPYPYSVETAATANNVKILTTPDFRLKPTSTLLTKGSFTHPKISNTINPLGLTELANIEAKQVVLFPNPATSMVEMALSQSFANGVVNILNSVGSVVLTHNAEGNSAKFDVSNLANGLYIVTVRNGNNVVNKTLVINK